MKTFNLGWGEPEVVKQAVNLVYQFGKHPYIHSVHDSFYPPHTGFDALKESISAYMLERSGILYPPSNIFITNGATGAISAAIMAYHKIHSEKAYVLTNDLYFGFYPKII